MHKVSESAGKQQATSAQVVQLQELAGQESGKALLDGNFSLIAGVKVKVEVVVGGAELSVAELFALKGGSVLTLDQLKDAPLAVRLDGKTIALGTLVVVGESFGLRISEVLPAQAAAAPAA